MSGRDGEITGTRRRSLGGRRAAVGAVLLIGVCTLWWRGRDHANLLAGFGPQGKLSAAMSVRGQILLAVTNIEMGDERAWTVQTDSVAAESGLRLRDQVMDAAQPKVSQRWGFMLANQPKDALGLPGRWCVVVGIPHWVVLPVLAWPVAGWVARRGRQWRRKRRGWCLACGYDLRGSAGRCPECGERVGDERTLAPEAASPPE